MDNGFVWKIILVMDLITCGYKEKREHNFVFGGKREIVLNSYLWLLSL